MVPPPRPTDVQVLPEVLEVLVSELGEDHDGTFEALERMDAGREHGARLDGLGQPVAVDVPRPAQAALAGSDGVSTTMSSSGTCSSSTRFRRTTARRCSRSSSPPYPRIWTGSPSGPRAIGSCSPL